MAVDSSALVDGLKPFDIAGAMNRGNVALQGEIETKQKQQSFADQQVVRDLMSVPGTDFSTPKGIKEFMGHLQGRVSPDVMVKFGDMATQMQDAEDRRVLNLSKMGDIERQRYEATTDDVMHIFEDMDKVEDPEQRTAQINERLDAYKARGVPNMSEKAITNLAAMPWEQQYSIYKGSKHAKAVLARAKDEAQVKRLAELTRASKDGKVENWVTKEGMPLLRYQNGTVEQVDTETGESTRLAAMPEGAYKAGTKNPNGIKDSEAVSLTEEENQYIAEYQQTYGKQIPGIPAGSGAAARKARIEYMKAFVKMGKERGYAGDEAGELALTRDAAKEAAKRLYTQSKVIEAGEKDLVMVGKVIEDELKALGGVESPIVRKYWNKASTEWAGDPQFAGLNAAMTNFQEVAARVFSGQSGAGGTPVTYLHLAEQAIGKNPTLEQFAKTNQIMTKLFDARAKSTEAAIRSLRDESRMVPKAGAAPTAAEPPKDSITEPDAREELKRAREAYRTATDPEQKRLAGEVVKDLEKKVGGADDVETDTRKKSKSGKWMNLVDGKWVYE